jgi:hypothetical protein
MSQRFHQPLHPSKRAGIPSLNVNVSLPQKPATFAGNDFLFLRAAGENRLQSNRAAAFATVTRFSPECGIVRVLVCCPFTQKFFNGDSFSANRDTAHDFKHARDAIEAIRACRWFAMQIVLAYAEPNDDMRINAHLLGPPNEVEIARLMQRFKPALP